MSSSPPFLSREWYAIRGLPHPSASTSSVFPSPLPPARNIGRNATYQRAPLPPGDAGHRRVASDVGQLDTAPRAALFAEVLGPIPDLRTEQNLQHDVVEHTGLLRDFSSVAPMSGLQAVMQDARGKKKRPATFRDAEASLAGTSFQPTLGGGLDWLDENNGLAQRTTAMHCKISWAALKKELHGFEAATNVPQYQVADIAMVIKIGDSYMLAVDPVVVTPTSRPSFDLFKEYQTAKFTARSWSEKQGMLRSRINKHKRSASALDGIQAASLLRFVDELEEDSIDVQQEIDSLMAVLAETEQALTICRNLRIRDACFQVLDALEAAGGLNLSKFTLTDRIIKLQAFYSEWYYELQALEHLLGPLQKQRASLAHPQDAQGYQPAEQLFRGVRAAGLYGGDERPQGLMDLGGLTFANPGILAQAAQVQSHAQHVNMPNPAIPSVPNFNMQSAHPSGGLLPPHPSRITGLPILPPMPPRPVPRVPGLQLLPPLPSPGAGVTGYPPTPPAPSSKSKGKRRGPF